MAFKCLEVFVEAGNKDTQRAVADLDAADLLFRDQALHGGAADAQPCRGPHDTDDHGRAAVEAACLADAFTQRVTGGRLFRHSASCGRSSRRNSLSTNQIKFSSSKATTRSRTLSKRAVPSLAMTR